MITPLPLLEAAVETNNTTDETQQMLEECRELQGQGSRIQGDSRIQEFKRPRKDCHSRLSSRGIGISEKDRKDYGQAATEGDKSVTIVTTDLVKNKPSNSPTLSLCMIAKNEEDNIERALMSVRPVVDEMIVVDTGSTDRTKEIAQALGANVYDFKWTNDFSAARNFSFSKASGRWILVLDADEAISQLDYEKLRALVPPLSSPFSKEQCLQFRGRGRRCLFLCHAHLCF